MVDWPIVISRFNAKMVLSDGNTNKREETMETENKIRITTNNVRREVLYPWQLCHAELKEFDYLIDAPDNADNATLEALWYDSGATFFRYRGELYDIGEFSRVIAPGAERFHPMECAEPAFQGWDGYQSDSFFSGLLIKYLDSESVVVGTYSCWHIPK